MARRVSCRTGALASWKRWMRAAASASSLSSGTARVMRPIRSASAAERLPPPRIISKAFLRPTRRGRRAAATVLKTPPLISGWPNFGRSARPGTCRRPRPAGSPRPGRARPRPPGWACRASEVLEDAPEVLEHHVGAVAEVVGELEARGEVLARGGQHHELDVALVLERLEGGVEVVHHVDGEHVGGRPVEGDAGDPLHGVELDVLVRRVAGRGVDVDVVGVFEVVGHSLSAPFCPSRGLEGGGQAHAAADAQGGQAAPAPRRAISCSSVTTMRAPVAPIGWPRAMAPPFTLSFSGSKRSSRSQASTWAAKASFTSTRSKSSRRSDSAPGASAPRARRRCPSRGDPRPRRRRPGSGPGA